MRPSRRLTYNQHQVRQAARFPESHLADDAHELRAILVWREQAFKTQMASDDPAVLKQAYPKGVQTDEVRWRLRRLKPSRRGLVTACMLGVVVVGSVGVWFSSVAPLPPAVLPSRAPTVVPPGDSASRSKAMLYEEDESNPAGQRFVGSAVWRTDLLAPAPGKPPEIAIRADIEIPEQRINLSWSLRRNDDKALPASHTIDIMFTLPADFLHGDISDIPVVTMKQGEATIGVPLTGLRVKVTNNYFLIGLSSADADMQRNIALLKERSWIDIPVVYGDGKGAIVTIEKGTSGERVFGDAFAAWGKISVAPPVVVPSIVPPAASGSCDGRATTVSLASRCAAPLSAAEERELKPKDSFKECDNCPEMLVVPADSFMMGSPGRFFAVEPLLPNAAFAARRAHGGAPFPIRQRRREPCLDQSPARRKIRVVRRQVQTACRWSGSTTIDTMSNG